MGFILVMKMKEEIRPEYYKGKIEVWDFILDKELNFLAGNVVKYICRYQRKNGIEDLIKAKTYLEKLISEETLT